MDAEQLKARFDLIAPGHYAPVGPQLVNNKLTPAMAAALSDAQLNRWHYAERHEARRLARQIVALESRS